MSSLATPLAVTGDLIFATVPGWRRSGRQYIVRTAEPVIEFKDISACDSSGVALLLAWLRDAQESGKVLRFAHPPQQLLDVARVYGVLDVLNRNKTNG